MLAENQYGTAVLGIPKIYFSVDQSVSHVGFLINQITIF